MMAPMAKTALLGTGAYAALRKLRPSRQAAILRYHAICSPDACAYASPGICISPEAFERHVQYLANNYSVLPLADVVGRLRERRRLPKNCVAITFDDGYADNLPAARLLARYGLTATFFIAAGCLAGGEPFWPAEIRELVQALTQSPIRLSVPGTEITLEVGGPAQRVDATGRITKLFKSVPIPAREALRAQLREAAGQPALPECMLRWDELEEMAGLGMTIGAHTLTHPNLPSAGLADATAEIRGSKALLEERLGRPVTLFSYPNGGAEEYYTPDLQAAVRDAGFEASATSRNGFTGESTDLYALERVQVAERLEDLVFALEVERFAFVPTA